MKTDNIGARAVVQEHEGGFAECSLQRQGTRRHLQTRNKQSVISSSLLTCRFLEGTSINVSLLMLGSVVAKLATLGAEGRRSDQFIPYRNSKLTRLLQVRV
jgi:hypothetical protein